MLWQAIPQPSGSDRIASVAVVGFGPFNEVFFFVERVHFGATKLAVLDIQLFPK
jgi:hypothetical protein